MSEKSSTAEKAELNISLEEAFAKLDSLISELEKPENSLEASFKAFEEGMQLVKYCNDSIDKVEKKVLVLGQDGELDEF
ncbi:MAG: exodeoxyribonuclease VII small subunit [Lachnospiraceae bacterium]|nr:exodeoxyribonuclease VII small subunit [Lachnospiraceae bacterium]